MLLQPSFAALLVAASTAGIANAFFKVQCSLPIVQERVDPILDPGTASGHLHSVHGGNNFGMNMTYASARESSCTSCQVGQDLSNYWIPTLYFKDPVTGEFTKVPNGGLLVYYLDRGDGDKNNGGPGLTAFPEGFRMLSGNAAKRSLMYPPGQGSQGELAERALQGSCLRYGANQPNSVFTGWPTTDCESGFRAQLHFPSCWDGKNNYLPGNTHVTYMSGLDNGSCDADHPVYLVHLFFEVTWDVSDFASQWVPQGHPWPFVWSNGDPTGFGWHGDFYNGWDVPVLQSAILNCNTPGNSDQITGGLASACPDLTVTGQTEAAACQIDRVEVAEDLGAYQATPLKQLPGCNPLQYGPGNATMYTAANCPGSVAPTTGNSTVAVTHTPPPFTMTTTTTSAKSTTSMSMSMSTTTMSSSSKTTAKLTTTVKTTTSTPASMPTAPASSSGYMGCYDDSASARTLSGYSMTSPAMTNAMCVQTCAAKGYAYAGTEYSSECYCGNSLPSNMLDPTQGWCNGACAGDKSTMCGGSYKLSVSSTGVKPTERRRSHHQDRRRRFNGGI